jgi:hypothetical protein
VEKSLVVSFMQKCCLFAFRPFAACSSVGAIPDADVFTRRSRLSLTLNPLTLPQFFSVSSTSSTLSRRLNS